MSRIVRDTVFNDASRIVLAAPSIRCGACMAAIENALRRLPQVEAARVNLTLRRIEVRPSGPEVDVDSILARLEELGHPSSVIDASDLREAQDRTGEPLLRAVAVAGFGAMNVMLLSVAVWSGAGVAARETFHLLSALIALPVVAYSSRFFFASAWTALRNWRLNMDVPIALAILLAMVLSLYETARGGDKVFFDAAVTLTFFLLIGRYLDHRMRQKARGALTGLAKLAARGALEVLPDGRTLYVAANEIVPDMVLRIPAGERMPVDCRILRGSTDLDRALVTGESLPVGASPGDEVEAGALNVTGPVDVLALQPVGASFLAEMMRMLATAEEGRGRYVRIADRAAQLYAPLIHLLAAATFLCWMLATGDWQRAAFVAISVLIVTCPCALALAVPVAHVVAAGRLLGEGILMKDGSALERMAGIDRAVFDKTGTLTTGTPVLQELPEIDARSRAALAALAARSMHPAARAIAERLPGGAAAINVVERPGLGIEGIVDGRRARLGRPSWVTEIAASCIGGDGPAFALAGGPMLRLPLDEALRDGARAAVADLHSESVTCELLSGDGESQVGRIAARLGFDEAAYGTTPSGKVARLAELRALGHRTLMVGDGLNDTAALAAADVSMAPASAADAGRAAADFVFLRQSLDAVPLTLRLARRTARIVRQNFGLAVLYNCIAVPLAVAGLITPLIAAIAMSASSLAVVANSLRLNQRASGSPVPERVLREAPA